MTRRKAIALLMNDAGLGDDYQGALRRGVEQACFEHDLDLRVYAGRADWTYTDAQRRVYEMMRPQDIDGIVVAAGCIASYAPLEETLEGIQDCCPVAICAVGQRLAHIASIIVDNFGGASKLVEHIVSEHGRREIAYIAGPADHEESRERVEGTRHALLRLGLEFGRSAIIHGDFSFDSGRAAVLAWLGAGHRFDAVLAASDDMAAGALEALRLRAINCPNDVVVAGFDDASSARLGAISLTTVRQPIVRAGASAVHHLIGQWQQRKLPDRITLPTEIAVRESCGCRPNELWRTPSIPSESNEIGAFRPAELVELLKPLLDSDMQREQWARELCRGAEAERAGKVEALGQAIDGLIATLPDPQLPIHALQRVITHLRTRAREREFSPPLEEAFHGARVAIGGHAYRRVGMQLLQHGQLLEAMRYAWEGLATSLTLPLLSDALAAELPRLEVDNAVISLHVAEDPEQLIPLLCLEQGKVVPVAKQPYPLPQLIPAGAFTSLARRVLTVLPLTFKNERLGVAVLDLPQRLETYSLLREQIGSVIKAAQLHAEVVNQERLRIQAEEVERTTAERLKALSIVAGSVAHDLNNALGPILALPEFIQRNLKLGLDATREREVHEDLDAIREAAQRAAATIRDLLTFGRTEEFTKEVVDVASLLEQERAEVTRICEQVPGISLHYDVGTQPLLVRASSVHVRRAVCNLVIHAVDAIQGSGEIFVTAAEQIVVGRIPGYEHIPDGRYAVLQVRDTSCGIDKEQLRFVFEPFLAARQHPERAGTGLGLAILHHFVEASAGHVRVESEVGKGTVFSLYFPLCEGEAAASSVPVPVVDGGPESILVVDDEAIALRTARRILSHLGYSVTSVQSGDEAIKLFTEAKTTPRFDLVLVDMVMPGLHGGIATIDAIRRICPEQKALIASGYAPDEVQVLATARTLPWLAKPYTMSGLATAVRSVLGTR